MARSNEEVIEIIKKIYKANFSGKEGTRFLISWEALRSLFGFERLFYSRFENLRENAPQHGLYFWDLGQGDHGYLIAVVKSKTVNRWRKVPKKIIEKYQDTDIKYDFDDEPEDE
jgi:hypothetical protein